MKPTRDSLFAIAFLVVLVGLGLFSLSRAGGQGGLGPGGDFTLTSAQGPVATQSFRGRVVLVFFGYLGCPDVCPKALGAQGAAFRLLTPQERSRVAGLFISLDPERDTPAAVQECAQAFHPLIQGLTGPAPELADVARRYGVLFSRSGTDSAGRYAVDHTSDTFVLAPDGRLVARLAASTPPEAIAAELRHWLR